MEIERIEFPEHLNHHTLSAQELANLNNDLGKIALATDWNVMGRKLDWLIGEAVFIHNTIARHDQLLEIWKRCLWLGSITCGAIGGILTIIKLFK